MVWASDPVAIEAVLAFLPYFFIRALLDHRLFRLDFNWPDWQDRAKFYVQHPDRLARARLPTLQKPLITHLRKDRFRAGHLAAMIECGHILAILQRLNALYRRPE